MEEKRKGKDCAVLTISSNMRWYTTYISGNLFYLSSPQKSCRARLNGRSPTAYSPRVYHVVCLRLWRHRPAQPVTPRTLSRKPQLSPRKQNWQRRMCWQHRGKQKTTCYITFNRFFTVSLWAQSLPFQKIVILHLSLFLSVGLISRL